MAYIESFKIYGLAGRQKPIARTLHREVNIFWGLNGTGKTALLKLLNSALSNRLPILRGVPFDRAEVVFWSTDHQAKIQRTLSADSMTLNSDSYDDDDDFDTPGLRLEPAGDGLWREVADAQNTRAKSWTSTLLEGEIGTPRRTPRGTIRRATIDANFRHAYLPISRLSQATRGYTGVSTSQAIDDAFLDDDFASQVRMRWSTYNTEALARIRGIQQQGLASILALLFGGSTTGSATSFDSVSGKDAYDLVREFLREQAITLRVGEREFLRRYDQQGELRDVVASIQDVTQDVDEALRPQNEFQHAIETFYSGNKRLILDNARTARNGLRVEVNGAPVALQSLSSGEKQLLRLMLEVLAAENATVMIDEPELSMHVDWQQRLVTSMRRINPSCQLLFATHSPEIMADLPDEYVFEL